MDIAYAREHGITVTGIRDYGDEGVAEYVPVSYTHLDVYKRQPDGSFDR